MRFYAVCFSIVYISWLGAFGATPKRPKVHVVLLFVLVHALMRNLCATTVSFGADMKVVNGLQVKFALGKCR